MKNSDKIYNFLFALLCFVIPLSGQAKAVPNILIIPLVLLFTFHSQKKNILLYKKELGFLLLFILIILTNTILLNRFEDLSMISRLCLIPVLLALSTPIQNFKTPSIFYTLGALSILVASAINITSEYIDNTLDLTNGAHINDLILGERPYLGFIYLTSAILSSYLGYNSKNNIKRITLISLSFIFIGFIYLIAARVAAISSIIVIGLSIFYYLKNPRQYLVFFVSLIVFFALLFLFSDNLSKRFYLSEDSNITFLEAEPRYYIWDCAYQIKPDNLTDLVFGNGYELTEKKLKKCYELKNNFFEEEQKQWFINSGFNTHNQYLDLLLSQGIICTVILLGGIIYLFITNRKIYFSTALICSSSLFLLVENTFTRQIGCMLIAFILCFISNSSKNKNRFN